jgi:hypothetical protein
MAQASAQAGAATDVIVGRVTDASGAPVPQASVVATSVANGLSHTTVTTVDGRYRLVFADGGGRYTLRVRRLGFAPVTLTLERRPETDRIAANVTLTIAATTLAGVTVTASRGDSSSAVGATGRHLTPDAVNRLPIDATGDLAALAALSPGVIGTSATDTAGAQFSVAGQRPTQNHISLDGLTFGPSSIPRDAVRETRIVTSTYDVAKGQFSGGEVASTTRSGTNVLQGTLSYDMRTPSLEVGAAPSAAFSREYQQIRANGSVGGAFVKDRAFGFGAIEYTDRTNPLATLLNTDPLTDTRLGIASDTVQRLLSLASSAGLPLYPPGVPQEQVQRNGSAIGRMDVVVNETNHLTIRIDAHGSDRTGTRANPRNLLVGLGRGGGAGGGVLVGLTTQAGSLTSDARLTAQVDARHEAGYLHLPRARIFVTSPTANGTLSTLDVSVGGNPNFPTSQQSHLIEGGEEVAWLSPAGDHRVKIGFLANYRSARTDDIEERNGTYVFNSLADFASNTPASFSRVLTSGPRGSARSGQAIYLGDAWQPGKGLEIDFGARVEASQYWRHPVRNPDVESAFGLRTDRFPSEQHVSPRIGFTYAVGGDKADDRSLSLRGGFGEFRGVIPPNPFAEAVLSTGLSTGQNQLTCTGVAVPAPDWPAYLSGSVGIPSSCAGDGSSVSGRLPNVVAFAKDAAAPRVWRASLGASRKLIGPLGVTVDLFYSRGVSQIGRPDLNLDTVPRFRLSNEGMRAVYVPASTIDPGTGALSLNASRRDPRFASVSEVKSFLRSAARQVSVGLNGEMASGANLEGSYTYSHVRDQALGFDGEGSDGITAGNPNRAAWGDADEERRHQFLFTLVIPLRRGLELSLINRFVSGVQFTPGIGQDINGDGQRNEQSYVFDPAATADTALAHAMQRLIDTGPATARACLTPQFGRIAERNGCTGPWVPGLDLKLNVTPRALLGGRWTVSVTALNSLVGLDQLLHGKAGLHGWGQEATVDRRLLFVTGFAPSTQTFRYQVNQHFGASTATLNPFRTPFVLSLQARAKLGRLKRGGGASD